MLLVFSFVMILVLVFAVVALMTRPTTAQKAVERRISTVIASRSGYVFETEGEQGQFLEEANDSGWLGSLAGRSSMVRDLQLLILRSQKNVTADSILLTMLGFTVGGFVLTYMLTSLLLAAFAVAAVAAYLPILWLRMAGARRLKDFNAALPDCIETCSRSLRAGHSVVAAISIVAELAVEPAKTEFGEVFKKQNYGLPLRDALLQMLERVPSTDLQVFVTSILVQKDTGGNLAEVLDRTVAVIRDRLRIQGEIRTHTAQGRLTGWILLLLPVVLFIATNLVNPGYSSVLFHTELGKKLLYLGAGLLVIGGFLIRQIIHGIEV